MSHDREGIGADRTTAAEVHGVPVPELETILRTADAAASVAHDFIWGRQGVTKEQASDAIWTIHNSLRPLFEDDPEPGETQTICMSCQGPVDLAETVVCPNCGGQPQ